MYNCPSDLLVMKVLVEKLHKLQNVEESLWEEKARGKKLFLNLLVHIIF